MPILKTHTLTTDQPDTFLVYWTNSEARPRGLLRVRVAPEIQDRHIVAELAAIQHLLEDKAAAGRHVVGNANTRLVVSRGAIRKLQRMESDKEHLAPYANFLTTRFSGCPLSVEKDKSWFAGFAPEPEDLLVSGPRRETLRVCGLGEVSVTHHVLERFTDRFLSESEKAKASQIAWKKLREVAADPMVREVACRKLWGTLKQMREGKQPGRYFLNRRHNLVLVVTDNPGEGMRLVTAYATSRQFHELARAA